MANIIDYIGEVGKFGLLEAQFNPVDSLILAQLSYLRLDGRIPGVSNQGPVCMKELLDIPDFENMFKEVRDSESNKKLFLAAAASRRFCNTKLNYYVNNINNDIGKQFSAVTFFLDGGITYIAIRGTDSTIVGWKEDFNMAFMCPVPAQEEGVCYINEVARRFPGKFVIGGHSKGGNIAVYSSIKCNCEVQDRISAVYSFDGPGFPKDIFSCPEYIRVKKRIHQYLPQSSIIGMIMEHQASYSVVESNQFWIFQHAPFSWRVEDDNFKYIYEIKATSVYMNKTLNNWINSVDMEKRKLFVETVFQVISVTNAKTLFDLADEWKKNAIAVLFAINGIDRKTKGIIARLIMSLFVLAFTTPSSSHIPDSCNTCLRSSFSRARRYGRGNGRPRFVLHRRKACGTATRPAPEGLPAPKTTSPKSSWSCHPPGMNEASKLGLLNKSAAPK